MSKDQAAQRTSRKSVDVTSVKRGQIVRMTEKKAAPSGKLRAAIDRAAIRQR
ncbi:hypothetical protein [Nocardia takedensis]|uniref:hypothetical protein n=1 Tax=Nocardia takedensis TaxID=259390 RepID=UPI0012F62A3B|nr:hypothetical protein [Nocardia takedensis]